MRTVLVLAVILLAAGCGPIDPAYTGKDAGTLVYGVGFETTNPSLDFLLQYREIRADGSRSGIIGSIRAKRSALDGSTPAEFGSDAAERGQLVVQHLKPGRYEIFYYKMSWACSDPRFNICVESNDIHQSGDASTESFSLPFAVEPGKAVYIGDYSVYSNSPNILAPHGVIFITDKSTRDLAIARKRNPALGEITVAVPDASQAQITFLKPGPTPAR